MATVWRGNMGLAATVSKRTRSRPMLARISFIINAMIVIGAVAIVALSAA